MVCPAAGLNFPLKKTLLGIIKPTDLRSFWRLTLWILTRISRISTEINAFQIFKRLLKSNLTEVRKTNFHRTQRSVRMAAAMVAREIFTWRGNINHLPLPRRTGLTTGTSRLKFRANTYAPFIIQHNGLAHGRNFLFRHVTVKKTLTRTAALAEILNLLYFACIEPSLFVLNTSTAPMTNKAAL